MAEYSPLIPIQTSNIDPSWRSMIDLESSPQRLIEQLQQDKKIDPLDTIAYLHRVYILHWVVKLKWNSKHKLPKLPKSPKGKDYKACYQVLGALYESIVDLCLQCHSFEGYSYRNAAEWFALIFLEGAIEGGNCSNEGKSANRVMLQRQNRCLDNYENPIDPKAFPHTWALIEVARGMAEKQNLDIFRREFWRPFIKCRKAWVNELKRPEWDGLRFVGGELRVNKVGKETQKIPAIVMVKKNGVPEIQIE